jgi:hypothetical protein
MALFDGYNIEQLNRILTLSRWILLTLALLIAIAGILNQYISDKIYRFQKVEKDIAEQRLIATEKKIAPRIITEHQAGIILSILSKKSKKQNVPLIIATRMMDAESLDYGRQLANILEKAGLSFSFTELSTLSFSGLAVFHNPETDNSPVLNSVRQALGEADIPFISKHINVKRIPIQHEPAVYIVIGHK